MADKTVYVQPVGDDRDDHYHTLSSALSGEYTDNPDLTAMAGILHICIRGAWSSEDTVACSPSNFITSSSYYLHIYTDTDNRASTSYNTSKYRLSTSGSTCYVNNSKYILFDGIQMYLHDIASDYRAMFSSNAFADASNWIRISNCLFRQSVDQTYQTYGISCPTYGQMSVWNTIIYDFGGNTVNSYAYRSAAANSVMKLYNCIGIGGRSTVIASNGAVTMKNCYMGGSYVEDYNGTFFTSVVNCASSDLSSDDQNATGCLTSIPYSTATFNNVTSGSQNFDLAGTGSSLYHAGVDHSGDAAPLNYTTDIHGDNYYSTPSIGVDEYSGLSSGPHQSTTITMNW